MTERSWYWEGTAVGDAALAAPYGAPYSDDMFSENFAKLFNYNRASQGVIPNATSPYSGGLAVSNPAGATIRVAAGYGLVDGRLYENTADIDTTPGNGDWIYVLRKTWAAQTIRATYKAYGALTQTDLVTWEIPLARVTIAAGVVTLLQDLRQFISAGGWTLINQTEIASTGDEVSWSSIPQCFKHLKIIGRAASESFGGGLVLDDVAMQFNGDIAANYGWLTWYVWSGGTIDNFYLSAQTELGIAGIPPADMGIGGNYFEISIPNYSQAVAPFEKVAHCDWTSWGGAGLEMAHGLHSGVWNSNAAINAIRLFSLAGSVGTGFLAKAMFSLYGLP